MKKIGPSFASELLSLGLTEEVSWNEEGGLVFNEDISQEDKDLIIAALEAHDPSLPAPLSVPRQVSRFQGREAMHQTAHGDGSLFEAAEDLLAQPSTPAHYKRAWGDMQVFSRDSEMLEAIATSLGLDSKQIDELFVLAAGIVA